jgi:hypothetical protein
MKNTVFWDMAPLTLERTEASEERVSSIIQLKAVSELD